jgi:hypothetical protein
MLCLWARDQAPKWLYLYQNVVLRLNSKESFPFHGFCFLPVSKCTSRHVMVAGREARLESYPGKEWVTSENKTVGILYMCRVVCPCSPIMSAQRSLVFTTWSSYVGFQRICSLPPSVFILSPSYSSSCEDTKSKRARTDVLLLSCRKSKPSTSAFMSSHTSILDSKTGSSVPDEHVSLFLRKHCSKHWCWPSQECWMQRYMTALLPPQVQYTLIAKTRSSSSVYDTKSRFFPLWSARSQSWPTPYRMSFLATAEQTPVSQPNSWPCTLSPKDIKSLHRRLLLLLHPSLLATLSKKISNMAAPCPVPLFSPLLQTPTNQTLCLPSSGQDLNIPGITPPSYITQSSLRTKISTSTSHAVALCTNLEYESASRP